MKTCRRCGSYDINPTQHGRQPGDRLYLCDVCYWRDYAERANEEIQKTLAFVRSTRGSRRGSFTVVEDRTGVQEVADAIDAAGPLLLDMYRAARRELIEMGATVDDILPPQ